MQMSKRLLLAILRTRYWPSIEGESEMEDVLNNRTKALSRNCNLIAYEGEYFDYFIHT